MSPPSGAARDIAPSAAGGPLPCAPEARLLRSAAAGDLYCVTVHGTAAGFVDLHGELPSWPRSESVFNALCLGWITPSPRGPRLQLTDAGRTALVQLDNAAAPDRPVSTSA